ncbi:MAG TPA: hypothetical protein VFX17_00160 [Patescibacteria group bacterium]|nr:hypothetical protein [Patescibacteria group bacterium]
MRFIWGLVWIAIGVGVIKYSFQITNFFGHVPWAEQHIGGGGTYTMYKIAGIVIIIFAFLYMFGNTGFLTGRLAPLFGGG